MTAFLAGNGFLEKSKNKGWQRVVGDDGERLSMRQVLAANFWSTSFVCPDVALPEISAPPNVESRAHHDTTHTDTHAHTQAHTGITPENIVEMPNDDGEARERRRYGLMGPMVDFLDENSPTSGCE